MGVIRFNLSCRIPSKKNRLASGGRGRRFFLPRDVRSATDSLVLQILSQLPKDRAYHPISRHAEIEFAFRASSTRQDRDGMATTVLDALVEAGILPDDCVGAWNGRLTVASAEVDRENPGVTITITCPDESQDQHGRPCLCVAKSQ